MKARRSFNTSAAPIRSAHSERESKETADGIELERPIELVVLSVANRAARCRSLGSGAIVNFHPNPVSALIPGEILTVKPGKQWSYAGRCISGEVQSARLDAAALGLVPLGLKELWVWDPQEHYWGEKCDPLPEWAEPIVARGPRPAFGMEQVLPGEDPDDPFSDPIVDANDLWNEGKRQAARKILMEICAADLRCLDAHAHLGIFLFGRTPALAIRHYEAGLRIGELSLGDDFDGVLLWGHINNRPFLRCMEGYGLCLWRLGRFEEAERVFDRMLWLNPSDNQGVRFLIRPVKAGRT